MTLYHYLRHEGQSMGKILQKPSSTMKKLALMRTATGKEDPELPLLQRTSSLELTAPQIAAQINASQSSSKTSTSTVQRRLRESGLHGRILGPKKQRDLLLNLTINVDGCTGVSNKTV